MPSTKQHLEQARAFYSDLQAQQASAYAARVVFLHLTGLHLIDARLAQHAPQIHPQDHRARNDLLNRAQSIHGVPRLAAAAYLSLLTRVHEVRYECPPPFRLERLYRQALEDFAELKDGLESVGVEL